MITADEIMYEGTEHERREKFFTTKSQPFMGTRGHIRRAFSALRKKGYFARMNFWCCGGCAVADIPDGTEKWVFFHEQADERLRRDGECYLGWGGDSAEIIQTLNDNGVDILWVDGDKSSGMRMCNIEPDDNSYRW